MATQKVCRDCKQTYPDTLEYFHRRRNGTNSYCKQCATARAKKHYQANHEHGLSLRAAYRDLHHGEWNEYWREYRKAHRDEKIAYGKAYHEANRSEMNEKAKRRYRIDPAPYVERARKWAAANPEKTSAHARKKNLRRRGAPVNAEAAQYIQLISQDPCCYCGQTTADMEIDHIHPLSRGGDSSWNNLTRACRSCNGAKQGKTLITYLYERANS